VTLVLFYHELSDDDSPLSVTPELFSDHLAVLASARANVLTANELLRALLEDEVPKRTVVLTFDDGFSAAVREACPRLDAVGMRATFFCVAGHLGGMSDWPSRGPEAPVRSLANAKELANLARAGHEIGSHGWSHEPLDADTELRREIVDSKAALEAATGTVVTTFAYPYGAPPTGAARALIQQTYAGAFGTSLARVRQDSALWNLPRADAHYLRNPRLLQGVVTGSFDAYLRARRVGSRTRRAFRKDYVSERSRE
jgi:peptidoglycan/xylan/chitin deacetylase (PgdA/CDA1 family)